jgi:hypothetical protein
VTKPALVISAPALRKHSSAIDREARLVQPARTREHFLATHALMRGQQALAVSDTGSEE